VNHGHGSDGPGGKFAIFKKTGVDDNVRENRLDLCARGANRRL
jgi:hypothetical protein